jgi:hypothetical protein
MKPKKRLQDFQVHYSRHDRIAIFKLLCPVRNDDWLPGWRNQREIIYAESGSAEPGCVFRVTNQSQLMGTAILINTVYQPYERIQYATVNPAVAYQIQWDLAVVSTGTEVKICRRWTALTTDAESFLAELSAKKTENMPRLFEYLEYYLDNGSMLKISDHQ